MRGLDNGRVARSKSRARACHVLSVSLGRRLLLVTHTASAFCSTIRVGAIRDGARRGVFLLTLSVCLLRMLIFPPYCFCLSPLFACESSSANSRSDGCVSRFLMHAVSDIIFGSPVLPAYLFAVSQAQHPVHRRLLCRCLMWFSKICNNP